MASSPRTEARHSWSLWRYLRAGAAVPATALYQVTDRLHEERTVRVPCNAIGPTVSAWLAELGASGSVAVFDDVNCGFLGGGRAAAETDILSYQLRLGVFAKPPVRCDKPPCSPTTILTLQQPWRFCQITT